MAGTPPLDRLEHYLLTSQMDDIEPLFVLYRGTMREVEGASLDLILHGLVKLVTMGLSKCYMSNSHLRPCKRVTFEMLQKRFTGQTEEQRKEHPLYKREYYFEITSEGKLEESKAIYDAYYKEKKQ